MLPRAATRSLRRRPLSTLTSVPSLQVRTFAKNIKPRRPPEYKLPLGSQLSPRHGPDALKAQNTASAIGSTNVPASSRSNNQSKKPDNSTLQEELQGLSRGAQNNVSQSARQDGPAIEPGDADASSQTKYSKVPNEDDTSLDTGVDVASQGSPSATVNSAESQAAEKEINSDTVGASRQESEVKTPLYDLTKGIPSTLDAELAESASSAKTDPNDLTGASSSGRGDRHTPASSYITSAEQRRNRQYTLIFASMILFALTVPIYFGRNWESEEEEKKHADAPSGWGLGLFYGRVKARLGDTLDYYHEPTFPKLLPNPDPAWERPYTLVLSLEDLLLHSEWTREHGWRMAKRPGVDYFLRYLSQYYELVIFTSVSSMNADPVIRKLDPYRIIMWPLFREATRYKNGEYIKDLSYLNRPLNKVILIDTVPSHSKLQPENAVILPKWTGNPNDNELVSLIPFLEYVASMGVEDTRTVLESFAGKHIPTEFAAREAQARERFESQLAAERAKRPKRSGVGRLGSALGIKPMVGMDGMMGEGFGEGFDQGKMLQDQIRERGQRQYELLEKEIRENGGKWLKEMAADEEKAKEEAMKGMKAGVTGWFGFGRNEKREEEGK